MRGRITVDEFKRQLVKEKAGKKKKETEIQNEIRDYLRLRGWFVIRHQQSLGSMKGLSDLTALKNGETIYIEVKTERGKQSEHQIEFQREIETHGGKYILARSLDDVLSLG